ncbi:MAG TPA: hypothetical protein VGD17_11025 [Chitinophagaceae bacterium]
MLPFVYCIYFQVKQQHIWHEMEEKLEKEQLQTITIPVNSFRWFKKNKEILVAGKMFDVKSITIRNNEYVVTGLYDEQETELHMVLQKMHTKQLPGSNAMLVLKLLSQQIAEPIAVFDIDIPTGNNNIDKFIPRDVKLQSITAAILTPPPKRYTVPIETHI